MPHSAPIKLSYPPELPVSARRAEIALAIQANQVVIVSGETGSGKTTQIPKILLELGYGGGCAGEGPASESGRCEGPASESGPSGGRAEEDDRVGDADRRRPADRGGRDGRARRRMIAHTQPRRIAARSVAERVSQELGVALGTVVGYQVRFTDHSSPSTRLKVMTDGILLAQIQSDPLLAAYDAIIVDEAHERSLNIDFLLGYLSNLLPKRPDLKVVITSATIDSDLFAAHFGAAPDRPAPVVQVTGRTYPVEVRYRPPGEAGVPEDQPTAIAAAVRELLLEGDGDILVFCSGEREIRDAAEALAADLGAVPVAGPRALSPPAAGGLAPQAPAARTPAIPIELLPLYSRLSAADQHRVFEPHARRRIVLATNVAETSLTVPGVHYVIDPGTARISRYSKATKVQRLPI
jgi:ATP-dependent helicase HrpA